ncbi:MAG: gliding motility-associated C-terminal domain-containing protein [Bacteroidetes bacterium]|nr:gliding motility-associated C-terminal domain-containing protein [Bacteroidota bacterium]
MGYKRMAISVLSVSMLFVLFSECKKAKDAGATTTTLDSNCNNLISIYSADSTAIALSTAFSPNGDGKNDLYRPIILYPKKISNFSLSIYKQSGALVYQTSSTSGWDGVDMSGAKSTDYKYQVKVSFTNASGIKVDTCTYLFLLRNSSAGCLNDVAADKASYFFEDQFNVTTGKAAYTTNETLCN